MSLITVSGEPGSRHEEVARLAAQRLRFELVTSARLNARIAEEFGDRVLPDDAWVQVATSMLARLATERHLLICAEGAERLFPTLRDVLRAKISAPESSRIGALMIDRALDRESARKLLKELDAHYRLARPSKIFDVVLNGARLSTDQMAELLIEATRITGASDAGLLPFGTEAQLQFQARLALAGHGIAPSAGLSVQRRNFSHPSEEIFANLLDFYRIAWEYEPRSFPIEWDAEGRVAEAFTPDFFLPEFDTYIELTTMKQSLVTKKNRKVRRLKDLYPDVSIQVFYQKDFENLIFKYGLTSAPAPAPAA